MTIISSVVFVLQKKKSVKLMKSQTLTGESYLYIFLQD